MSLPPSTPPATQPSPQDDGSIAARIAGKWNVVSACVTGIFGIATVVLAVALANESQGSDNATPLTVKFEPNDNDRTITYPADFAGSITGLRGGQSIWLFSEPSGDPSDFYPQQCVISSDASTWSCTSTSVGRPTEKSGAMFTVWVTVVSSETSTELSTALQSCPQSDPALMKKTNCRYWYKDETTHQPPHLDGQQPLDKMEVTRR